MTTWEEPWQDQSALCCHVLSGRAWAIAKEASMFGGTSYLLPRKPGSAGPLRPVIADSPVEEEAGGGSFDGDTSVRISRPKLRKQETGLSLTSHFSHLSAISQFSQLHRVKPMMHPKMRRSQSALSSLSQKTGSSAKSKVPEELGLEIGLLRGHSTVSLNCEWPVTDEYEFEDHLGEGGFGQVFMAKHRGTEEYYAVKRIPAVSVKDMQRYEREIRVFERLKSCYIVRLCEIFRDETFLYLVMDLCTGGDLMNYMMTYFSDPAHPERANAVSALPNFHHCLPAQEVGVIIWQMLAGIAYMHHHRFVHRDVKLENYMLAKREVNPTIQLCDFGLSVRIPDGESCNGTVGTLLYMAPEVMATHYAHKCDIWSVGVSAYIVATLCSPWGSSSDEADVKSRILGNRREAWPKAERPMEMKKVIDQMMTYHPNKRPSAKEVYAQSRWLRKHRPQSGGSRAAGCSVT